MKSILITVAAALVVAASPGYGADTKIQSTQSGKPHMEFARCPAKGQFRLFVRSGEIRIVGSDEAKLSIDLTGRKSGQIQDVKARLTCSENSAELHVTGGPHNDLTITIHVPKSLDLYARIPAGEISVEGITGNKDVELHVGELTIDVVNPRTTAMSTPPFAPAKSMPKPLVITTAASSAPAPKPPKVPIAGRHM